MNGFEGALGIFLGWWTCPTLERAVGYTCLRNCQHSLKWTCSLVYPHFVTDPLAQLVGRVGGSSPGNHRIFLQHLCILDQAPVQLHGEMCHSSTDHPHHQSWMLSGANRHTYAGSGESEGSKVLPPWSRLLGILIFKLLIKKQKPQKESLTLPLFLPKRVRKRTLLWEGPLA